MEHRIDMFLEKEKVRNVMFQDYLKALGMFTEIKKCEKKKRTKNKIVDLNIQKNDYSTQHMLDQYMNK